MPWDGSGTYHFPAASGLLPKDLHTQTWNRAALADLATALTTPGCLLLRTSGQDFTSGAPTAFSWQASAYNNGLWALTPTPSQITIPAGITWATFRAAYYNQALTTASAPWPLYFYIYKNVASFNGAPVFACLIDPTTTAHGVTISTPWVPVSAGDYFEIYLVQVSGVTQTFCGSDEDRTRTWFSCEVRA